MIKILILGFAHNYQPTFYGSQKEYATQKIESVKGPRKMKNWGKKEIENG